MQESIGLNVYITSKERSVYNPRYIEIGESDKEPILFPETVEVLKNYSERFPHIVNNSNEDYNNESISAYLQTLNCRKGPFYNVETKFINPLALETLYYAVQHKNELSRAGPHKIYRFKIKKEFLTLPQTDNYRLLLVNKPNLYDRVISIGFSNVPLGNKGTVIGYTPNRDKIFVAFDEPFLFGGDFGGLCSNNCGV